MTGAEHSERIAGLRARGRFAEAASAAAAALAEDSTEAWRRGLGYEERRRLGGQDPLGEWRAFEALRRRRPREAGAHALAGLAAHAAGRWDEGRAAFERAARVAPKDARWARAWSSKLRCWQAESLLAQGRPDAAFTSFADAVRAAGGAAWVRAWSAQAELWCGRPERAEKTLRAALSGDGDWSLGRRSWAVGWLALSRLAAGDARSAERGFDEALRGDPGDAESLAGAAECAWRLGKKARALAFARRLAEAAPASPWAGVIETLAGAQPAAAWERLRAAAPGFTSFMEDRAGSDPRAAARAALKLCAGNRTPAPTALQFGADGGPRPVPAGGVWEPWLAEAREAALRVDAARGWVYAWSAAGLADAPRLKRLSASLMTAARAPGARAELWAWRGELSRKLGKAAEALVVLDKALALDPAYAPARAWKGEALRDLSRAPEARAALAAASASSPSPWVLALEARAWTTFTPAHLERALWLYDRALAAAPRSAWIRSWKGEALRRLKRWDEAVAELTWAAENGAPVGWAVTVLAETERKRGNFARAEELLAFAERADARWPWVHVTRSELARKRRRYEDAIACLRRAVAASGGAAWAYALLGRAQAVYRYKKEGLANLDRALKLDPLMGWAWGWRGEVRRRFGRLKEARSDFDRSIALDPDYAWAWAWRGGVKRLLGDLEGARTDLDEAVRLQENYPWGFAERSRVRRELGDLDGAMADLAVALRGDPKYRWSEHPSRAASAAKPLEGRVKRHPRDGAAWAWLGQARADGGDAAGGADALRRAVALLPRGELRGWARAWLGEILLRLNLRKEATASLRAASREAPGYAPAHGWLGGALALAGDRKAAEAGLTRALSLDTRASWAWAWRAELRAARGDAAGARSDLDEALNLDPRYEDAKRLARTLGKAA